MKRLECLDGVRGLLAVYVMLGHMAPFAALPGWLQSPLSHGGAAVDMFFILSGLVIARSLDSAGYRARRFFPARAARIFPAFLIVFALAVAVQALPVPFAAMPWVSAGSPARAIWSGGWPGDWAVGLASHLTMTHGLFPDAMRPDVWVAFLGAAWSLSTEWQFYCVAFVFGRFGHGWSARGLAASRGGAPRGDAPGGDAPGGDAPRGDAPGKDGGTRAVFLGLLALAVAGAGWALLTPDGWHFSRAFLGNKAAWFAVGVASSAALEGSMARYICATALATAIALRTGAPGQMLVPVGWSICLAAQSGLTWPGLRLVRRVLRSAHLQWLGTVSYSLYLGNEPIQKLLGIGLAWLAGGNAVVFTLLWLPAATVLPILAAAWLRRAVEIPGLRLGRALTATAITKGSAAVPVHAGGAEL
jgi:peptidoglycan/LPS O-acetylase OafA/YrhL